MADVHDVAAYILARQGSMSAMKLQKLVYYSQAAALVETGRPLFSEVIRAWAHGPVVYELFELHRGQYFVEEWPHGDPDALVLEEKRLIDGVLHRLGAASAELLSRRTHEEAPWRDAREGARPGQRSSAEITPEAIRRFYQREGLPLVS